MSATGPDLHGRVCLVTGATSGIGRVTAEELAGMGATTLLVARDAERGERARRQIAATTGNQRLHVLLADLAAQAQVRRLAEQVRDRADRLHVIVNNGGLVLYRVLTPLARPFMKGPGQGADTVVWLASSPEVEGVNGRYFTRRRAIRSSKRSYDQDAARRLWEVSERLTGLLDQEKGERQ